MHIDRHYTDPTLASVYDASCADRPDFAFYLPLVMSARNVLDVGCGTGELLRLAREAGHDGRLCGIDPAERMLAVARKRTDIEWRLGIAQSIGLIDEFDLIVMTGHAFQVLVDDDELHRSLVAIRYALTPDGLFVFETRNPHAEAWNTWTPANGVEFEAEGCERVRMAHELTRAYDGRTVSFRTTYTSPAWQQPKTSDSTLRFLDAEELASALSVGGLAVEEQYGDWGRAPLQTDSPEIITVSKKNAPPQSDGAFLSTTLSDGRGPRHTGHGCRPSRVRG